MGVDLIPKNKNSHGLKYNWSGYRYICQFALRHGVPTEEFVYGIVGITSSEFISAETCRKMAKAIEANAAEYNAAFGGNPEPSGYGDAPAEEHARFWRESQGLRID